MKLFLISFFIIGFIYCQPNKITEPNYKRADSIANLYPGKGIHNLPTLVYDLTSQLNSDAEKFRAIHTWVCTNIENDYDSFKKTTYKRKKFSKRHDKFIEWNNGYLRKIYKRLIDKRKTACTGYAYLICQMATLADLKCEIVDGFAKTASTQLTLDSQPNHSWNAIKLDGEWFLCDATWSAGRITFDNGIPKFQFDYSDAYFLAPPELFSKNHYPIDTKWLLLNKSFSFRDFLSGPLVYKGAFENRATPLEPKHMFLEKDQKIPIILKLSTNIELPKDSVELLIIKGNSVTRVNPLYHKTENGITLTHEFKKSGLYDVHLILNDNVALTYVINVLKSSSYP